MDDNNNDSNTVLKFNYDAESKAEYAPILNEDQKIHMNNLFCNKDFDSTYFTHYEDNQKDGKYEFPFDTYGKLDSFFEEQKDSPILLPNDQQNLPNDQQNLPNDQQSQLNVVQQNQSQKLSAKDNLKIKWIYQSVQGIRELHEKNQYYGNLSSMCITINDDLNLKYTYYYDPPNPSKTLTITDSSLYLPPEFYKDKEMENSKVEREDNNNESKDTDHHNSDDEREDNNNESKDTDHHNSDDEIEKNKKYDIYALGMIINGIVTEKFPRKSDFTSSYKDTVKILINQKKDEEEYPKRNRDDPLWSDISSQIIDECLKPFDDRPNIDTISNSLDNLIKTKGIEVKDEYKEQQRPILESCIKNDLVRIPSCITNQISYQDVANTLSILENNKNVIYNVFRLDESILNPFNINIKNVQFNIELHLIRQANDVYSIVLSTIKLDDKYKEEFKIQYEIVNQSLIKKEYFENNIPFCSLQQLIDFAHNNNILCKDILNQTEIYSWLLYLAEYLALLEKNENDTNRLLPINFSSECVLISLLATLENKRQFKLSIFPYPVEESELSKIYNPDIENENFNSDIYAFGVLMFEILGLYPTQDQQKSFQSETMQDIYNKIREVNPNFQYNVNQLEKITEIIEKCLTIDNQPKSFEEIFEYLIKTKINQNFNLEDSIKKYKNCVNNQKISLSNLAYSAELLQHDSINELISNFARKVSDEEGKNPFIQLFNSFIRPPYPKLIEVKFSEYPQENQQENGQKSEDIENRKLYYVDKVEYPILFQLLLDLMRADKYQIIIDEVNEEVQPSNEFDMLKKRLVDAEMIYDEKCRNLPPTKINFQFLPICDVEFAMSTILRVMNPKIPHVLLITMNKPDYEEDDYEDFALELSEEEDRYESSSKMNSENDDDDYETTNNDNDNNDHNGSEATNDDNDNEDYETANNGNDNNNETTNHSNGNETTNDDNDNEDYETANNNNDNNNETTNHSNDNDNNGSETTNNNNNDDDDDDVDEYVVSDKSKICTVEHLKKYAEKNGCKCRVLSKHLLKVVVPRKMSPIFQGLKSLLDKIKKTSGEFKELISRDRLIDEDYKEEDYLSDDFDVDINIFGDPI